MGGGSAGAFFFSSQRSAPLNGEKVTVKETRPTYIHFLPVTTPNRNAIGESSGMRRLVLRNGEQTSAGSVRLPIVGVMPNTPTDRDMSILFRRAPGFGAEG